MTELAPPAPVSSSRPWSGVAIAALIVSSVLTIVLLSLKTLAASWAYSETNDFQLPATILGGLLLSGIVFDVLAVILGHLALAHTKGDTRRGRVLAAIALGAGYLHLLLWGNRLLNAVLASIAFDDLSQIMPNLFWWA